MSTIERRTLTEPIELTGTGVFTGCTADVRLIPVEKPGGIIFLVGDTRIPLSIKNLHDTPNRTTLSANGEKVELVEHLLACLHIAGITDLDIDCPNGEMPLLDGSAGPIWDAITSAGTIEMAGVIKTIAPGEPTYVEDDVAVLEH